MGRHKETPGPLKLGMSRILMAALPYFLVLFGV